MGDAVNRASASRAAMSPEPSAFHVRYADDPAALRVLRMPDVARAIETGDPFRVHAALRRARRGALSTADRADVDRLLADRRAFLRPDRSAPTLFTWNGFGTTFLGREDEAPDASYVANRWLSAFYVPLYPLASHLVVPDGRGWRFFGRVPVSPTIRLLRRVFGGVAAAAILFVVVTSSAPERASVRLLNGLDVAVTTEFGDRTFRLEPGARRSEDVPGGPTHVRTRTEDGHVVEEMDVHVPGRKAFSVYSVLGAEALHVRDVVYTKEGSDADDRDVAWTAQPWKYDSAVDYEFRDPPKTIRMRTRRETRRMAYAIPGGWRAARDELRARGPAAASEFCASVALADPRNAEALSDALDTAHAMSRDALRRLAERLRDREPKSIHAARGSQTAFLLLGERERLTSDARAAFDRDRTSATAGYLYARLLPPSEEMVVLAPLLAAHPDDPWLLRAAAWSLTSLGRHAEAVDLHARFARADPEGSRDALDPRARSLVALGKTGEAQRLVEDALAPGRWSELVLYAKLARAPGADPERPPPAKALSRVVPDATDTSAFEAEIAAWARDAATFDRLESKIESAPMRAARRLMVDAHVRLDAAAVSAQAADADVLSRLDEPACVTLACELLRRGDDEAARRVVGSRPRPPFEALRDPAALAKDQDLEFETRAALLAAASRSASDPADRDRLLDEARAADTFGVIVPR